MSLSKQELIEVIREQSSHSIEKQRFHTLLDEKQAIEIYLEEGPAVQYVPSKEEITIYKGPNKSDALISGELHKISFPYLIIQQREYRIKYNIEKEI